MKTNENFYPSWKTKEKIIISDKNDAKDIDFKLYHLKAALNNLKGTYGTWEIPWGQINRYQRVNPGDNFNDSLASIAVAQTSSKFGQLPAFESKIMFTPKYSRTKN
jgi:hypothetical protein